MKAVPTYAQWKAADSRLADWDAGQRTRDARWTTERLSFQGMYSLARRKAMEATPDDLDKLRQGITALANVGDALLQDYTSLKDTGRQAMSEMMELGLELEYEVFLLRRGLSPGRVDRTLKEQFDAKKGDR